jgi:hypothetical protein
MDKRNDMPSKLTRWAIVSLWIFGVFLVIFLLGLNSVNPGGRPIIKITGSDPVSYYSVAHSILFDGDLDLSNEYHVLKPTQTRWNAIVPATGLPGSPFPIGFSLLELPFLTFGHWVSLLVKGQSDGFSEICMTFYYVGLIFYLCVGMTFLFLFIRSVGLSLGCPPGRAELVGWFATFAVWPTTTVGHYTLSPMSHVCSFMASAAFLYFWWRAKDSYAWKNWLLCGITGGLLVLCRWEAALFLLVPFFYDILYLVRKRHPIDIDWLIVYMRSRFLMLLAVAVLFVPQLIEWKVIYGKYLTIPQGSSFFAWPPRYVLNVLFSTRHGLFVWTPITFIGVAGLLYGARRKPAIGISLLIAIALQVALNGSLPTNWHGNWSFGIRYLTACIPIVALGLAFWLYETSQRIRTVVVVGVCLCAIYTLIFAVQFRLDIVPKDDRLTVQELLVDKIFFYRALNRHYNYSKARSELDRSNLERAIEIAELSGKRYGLDRKHLKVLIEAYEQKGNLEAMKKAQKKLQALLDSRLF